jgi:hypothetical protein
MPFHFTSAEIYFTIDLQIIAGHFQPYCKYKTGGFKYKTEPKPLTHGFSFGKNKHL